MARNAPAFDLPDDLRSQMAQLRRSGFVLLTLGGADGKTPIIRNRAESNPSLSQVLGPMYGSGSMTYGIRLHVTSPGSRPLLARCKFCSRYCRVTGKGRDRAGRTLRTAGP